MSELSGEGKDRKELLKDLIKELHHGADPGSMRDKFAEIIKGVDSTEITRIEEELIKEGMPVEEIHRLCDVHIAVFKESLDKERVIAPAGHPVNILMEEHKLILGFAAELKEILCEFRGKQALDQAPGAEEKIENIVENLRDSEKHYVREENVLFPYLEKHGITQPPAIMWSEHDKIRGIKKAFFELWNKKSTLEFSELINRLNESAISISEMLASHFYKENNILFPTALNVITQSEWLEIKNQFEKIGYCGFTPKSIKGGSLKKERETKSDPAEGVISFETGSIKTEVLERLLDTLPVDITFVDRNDAVAYFSQSKDRIFPRAKAVIGRKVQQCHPQKSVHAVNQILDDFRNKKRDVAEFYIHMGEKYVHIRYFAIRGKDGDYLGCLEVTQDIAPIQKVTGEKRLL